MVKSTTLSNDLNFIKEFEELRLKQKLLVESLSKKNSSDMNQYLVDINSKLDFLVKIFKEANSNDLAEEETTQFNEEVKSNFKNIIDKIESIDKNFNDKFENMDKRLSKFDSELEKTEGIVERNLEKKDFSEVTNPIPSPDFKLDESKIDKVAGEGDKKKKKWF